jgi:hypothetical protein
MQVVSSTERGSKLLSTKELTTTITTYSSTVALSYTERHEMVADTVAGVIAVRCTCISRMSA